MLSLTYLSSTDDSFTKEQLDDLVRMSRARNERLGVTGMMLYSGGIFLQTLEGPDES